MQRAPCFITIFYWEILFQNVLFYKHKLIKIFFSEDRDSFTQTNKTSENV